MILRVYKIRDSKILRVYKIRDSKILRVYKIRDFKILRVYKIRHFKILRVYKISERDCNFYVTVTKAKRVIRDFKHLRDSKKSLESRIYVDLVRIATAVPGRVLWAKLVYILHRYLRLKFLKTFFQIVNSWERLYVAESDG